jgi:ABC-2 type transport system ATP-binding protein
MGEKKVIILSTHILEEIEAVTSKVLLINEGKKVFEGSPDELKKESKNAGSIILGVAGKNFEELQSTLEKVKGVLKVDHLLNPKNNMTNVRISHAEKGREKFSHDIMKVATKANWQVGTLKVDEGNLEDVFAALTSGEKTGGEK